MAIPTRTLGRTGVEVTMLGYGAMELRGEPRGPAITDAEAGRLLNAVLDEGHHPDRHLDRLRRQRGVDRALSQLTSRRVFPGLQVRLPADDAA